MNETMDVESVNVIIEKLNSVTAFQKKDDTTYFGEECWMHFNNNDSFFMHIEYKDVVFGIHAALVRGVKRMVVIVDDPDSFTTFNERVDVKDHFTSKYYDSEEEHFMDSTVKDVEIPYSLMQAVSEFVLKYNKLGDEHAI